MDESSQGWWADPVGLLLLSLTMFIDNRKVVDEELLEAHANDLLRRVLGARAPATVLAGGAGGLICWLLNSCGLLWQLFNIGLMLKKGIFVDKHFEDDANMSFALLEEDPVTKMPSRRLIPNPTAKHNFTKMLSRCEGDRARVADLADLLERMMALDPEKRLDPDAALRHPFVKDFVPKKRAIAAAAAGGAVHA